MITGAHSIIYSSNAEADIAFFKDVLKFPKCECRSGLAYFRLATLGDCGSPGSLKMVCRNCTCYAMTLKHLLKRWLKLHNVASRRH